MISSVIWLLYNCSTGTILQLTVISRQQIIIYYNHSSWPVTRSQLLCIMHMYLYSSIYWANSEIRVCWQCMVMCDSNKFDKTIIFWYPAVTPARQTGFLISGKSQFTWSLHVYIKDLTSGPASDSSSGSDFLLLCLCSILPDDWSLSFSSLPLHPSESEYHTRYCSVNPFPAILISFTTLLKTILADMNYGSYIKFHVFRFKTIHVHLEVSYSVRFHIHVVSCNVPVKLTSS